MSWIRRLRQKSRGPVPRRSTIMNNQVTSPQFPTDQDAYQEVFRSHWQQTVAIVDKPMVISGINKTKITPDEIETVVHHLNQMMILLLEERSVDGGQGPILEYLLQEDVLDRVSKWCGLVQNGEYYERLKLEQLKIYELFVSQANQNLIVHKPIIRPLLHLLVTCAERHNQVIEKHMILLLHHLCVGLTRDIQLLELFFSASAEQGPARFLIFSLLIPYVHHEGSIGQMARDALLLIMALSTRDNIGKYIAENSDFCPVLATGLSGLYSSLPRKLDVPSEDWCQLSYEDWSQIPSLVMFLNSLEFCNAVVQVAHPLVRDQLLQFIYNGFLVPVLGPALHQEKCTERLPVKPQTTV